MHPPYMPGDTAAALEINVRGGHVYEAHVQSVRHQGGHWLVETDHGRYAVDDRGVGTEVDTPDFAGELFPIDEEIALDLAVRGDGYEVKPTLIDVGRDIDRGHER